MAKPIAVLSPRMNTAAIKSSHVTHMYLLTISNAGAHPHSALILSAYANVELGIDTNVMFIEIFCI